MIDPIEAAIAAYLALIDKPGHSEADALSAARQAYEAAKPKRECGTCRNNVGHYQELCFGCGHYYSNRWEPKE